MGFGRFRRGLQCRQAGIAALWSQHHVDEKRQEGGEPFTKLSDILRKQKGFSEARKEVAKLDFTLKVPHLETKEIIRMFELFYELKWTKQDLTEPEELRERRASALGFPTSYLNLKEARKASHSGA